MLYKCSNGNIRKWKECLSDHVFYTPIQVIIGSPIRFQFELVVNIVNIVSVVCQQCFRKESEKDCFMIVLFCKTITVCFSPYSAIMPWILPTNDAFAKCVQLLWLYACLVTYIILYRLKSDIILLTCKSQ